MRSPKYNVSFLKSSEDPADPRAVLWWRAGVGHRALAAGLMGLLELVA
ncbi:hypothetical protein I1E95_04700 [Synechococcus sp. CBW1107]|nr:hypothetical protein [Synechococcus sp. CBW1107]QPN57418.1 hypothetical protein I1E95_04700 [Synechococcus sp. CBW1107]CAK6692437.1 hypothetical protein BBFGKLBO_01234 [Synechococcus sp. CBW1107]